MFDRFALQAAHSVSCLVLGFVGVRADASPVHITVDLPGGAEYGAGWSIGKGRECYVVTPAHVVARASANAIKVTDGSGRVGRAVVVKDIGETFDLALLKLSDAVGIECPEEWVDGADAQAQIRDADFLVAVWTDTNGRLEKRRLFVAGTSSERIELDPFGPDDRLQEGHSGSALFAGKTLVGMVTSVATGTGRVTAITQNQIHGLFGKDVLPDAARVVLIQPFVHHRQENPYATIAARNYISTKTPWRIVELSRPPNSRHPTVDAAPPIPAGVDYVLSGQLLEIAARNVANPNYKSTSKKKTGNAGDHILNSVIDSLGRHQNVRYFRVFNIDIEISLTDAAKHQTVKNLERRELRYLGDNADPGELEKTAIANAVGQALELTLRKHELQP